MKLKLGNNSKVNKLKYDAYKALAKKTINALATSNEISPFVLIKGEKLEWKTGTDDAQHLLYIGDIKEWKKNIAKEKWEKKAFSYGFCRVSDDGKEVKVELQINKGNLANNPALFNPIAKVFRTKFKPKLFLEVVPVIEGAPSEEEDSNEATTATDAPKTVTPEKLIAAFDKFKAEEVATFSGKKDATNAQALVRKGNAISKKMGEFLAENPDAKVEKAKAVIDKNVAQVSALVNKAQGQKAGNTLEAASNNINKAIEDLLQNFGSELDNLGPELKAALEGAKIA